MVLNELKEKTRFAGSETRNRERERRVFGMQLHFVSSQHMLADKKGRRKQI